MRNIVFAFLVAGLACVSAERFKFPSSEELNNLPKCDRTTVCEAAEGFSARCVKGHCVSFPAKAPSTEKLSKKTKKNSKKTPKKAENAEKKEIKVRKFRRGDTCERDDQCWGKNVLCLEGTCQRKPRDAKV